MQKSELFTQLYACMPDNVVIDLQKCNPPQEICDVSPVLARLYVLQHLRELDWNAYRAAYADVAVSGIDPIFHFARFGIHEDRKLFVKPMPSMTEHVATTPKVSIIVANYNNAAYLAKAVNSLCGQTLKDIEIIVVDDASTDNSLAVLQKLSANDPRIAIIALADNQSQHMARKTGVAIAHGDYIMFLDSDDYYEPDACEIAYGAIARGYDIVTFGVNIIESPEIDAKWAWGMGRYLNGGEAGEYRGQEISNAMFNRNAPCKTLWCKIYRRAIVQSAFAQMVDGNFPSAQDVYEIAAIALLSQTMLKIPDRLCNYRLGSGHSTAVDDATSIFSALAATLIDRPLRQLLRANGNEGLYEGLTASIYRSAIDALLERVTSTQVSQYFNMLASNLGILQLISRFMSLSHANRMRLAEKFRYYETEVDSTRLFKSVGILYSVLVNGGAERVIWEQAPILLDMGYKVTVFLERPHANDARFAPEIEIVYIGQMGNANNLRAHLVSLELQLRAHPVDVMFCHACYDESLLWQAMLIKFMRVPVVFFAHSAFFRRLLHPESEYSLQEHVAIMGCADKVAVLSPYEETFYRINGADAICIANPVRMPTPDWQFVDNFAQRKNNIISFGRLGERTKCSRDCLHILRLLLPINQDLRLTLIGSFNSEKAEEEFRKYARMLHVENNIIITGWIEEPWRHIDNAAILLSTAWHESFGLTICECQARGLPVVMYDMPIMPADANGSIIRIEHGDHAAAADAICGILANPGRWRKLSDEARSHARAFSAANYALNLRNMLTTFRVQSALTSGSPRMYSTILRTLAFYGTHLPPWT